MYLSLRVIAAILSVLALASGGLGMAASFLFLSSAQIADNIAGAAGFIAGAIFLGSGLISLSILGAGETAAAKVRIQDRSGDDAFAASR